MVLLVDRKLLATMEELLCLVMNLPIYGWSEEPTNLPIYGWSEEPTILPIYGWSEELTNLPIYGWSEEPTKSLTLATLKMEAVYYKKYRQLHGFTAPN
jgi:hypothetical protein